MCVAVPGPQGTEQAGPGEPLVYSEAAHGAPGRVMGTSAYAVYLQETWSISASPRQAQRLGDLPLLLHGHRCSGKASRGGRHQGGHSPSLC